ncbi:MAG: (S)-ureidoglycine aminohydrolase [Spirochaetaceae bacterium]|nr:MAG: (S)-ureidoglycine aminohydrolase [Spirochaetaceae bacterium]
MRLQTDLLGSRARVKDRYALIPLEGIPFSRLPEWPDALVQVLAAPPLGADFAQYRLELAAGHHGEHAADGEIEHFLYLLEGDAALAVLDVEKRGRTEHALTPGGFALIPPTADYRLEARTAVTLLLLRKVYEPVQGIDLYSTLVGREQDVPGQVYLGDEGALLQTLIPDEFAYDLAMNIFTFQTGHSLPVTETHLMEHGLYVLAGKGLYYLDDTWMEVEESDFIWMGPFCPQSYYATGPTPTRYIYYKNVNREIQL